MNDMTQIFWYACCLIIVCATCGVMGEGLAAHPNKTGTFDKLLDEVDRLPKVETSPDLSIEALHNEFGEHSLPDERYSRRRSILPFGAHNQAGHAQFQEQQRKRQKYIRKLQQFQQHQRDVQRHNQQVEQLKHFKQFQKLQHDRIVQMHHNSLPGQVQHAGMLPHSSVHHINAPPMPLNQVLHSGTNFMHSQSIHVGNHPPQTQMNHDTIVPGQAVVPPPTNFGANKLSNSADVMHSLSHRPPGGLAVPQGISPQATRDLPPTLMDPGGLNRRNLPAHHGPKHAGQQQQQTRQVLVQAQRQQNQTQAVLRQQRQQLQAQKQQARQHMQQQRIGAQGGPPPPFPDGGLPPPGLPLPPPPPPGLPLGPGGVPMGGGMPLGGGMPMMDPGMAMGGMPLGGGMPLPPPMPPPLPPLPLPPPEVPPPPEPPVPPGQTEPQPQEPEPPLTPPEALRPGQTPPAVAPSQGQGLPTQAPPSQGMPAPAPPLPEQIPSSGNGGMMAPVPQGPPGGGQMPVAPSQGIPPQMSPEPEPGDETKQQIVGQITPIEGQSQQVYVVPVDNDTIVAPQMPPRRPNQQQQQTIVLPQVAIETKSIKSISRHVSSKGPQDQKLPPKARPSIEPSKAGSNKRSQTPPSGMTLNNHSSFENSKSSSAAAPIRWQNSYFPPQFPGQFPFYNPYFRRFGQIF